MVDKVKPLKLETPGHGTQFNPVPKETNCQEDFIAAKGISFECSDDATIRGDSDVITFDDAENDPITLLELKNSGTAFAQFEAFSSDGLQSTTSNAWVTKSGFPYTTGVKEAGDYVIDFTAELTNSDKEKQVGFRVQYREGTSGTWITLTDIRNGVSVNNAFELRTGFRLITLSTNTEFQVRIQWGQTDDGGTGRIRNAAIKVARVA